jgi:ribonucleoside-diphosphate reductase alpha chain
MYVVKGMVKEPVMFDKITDRIKTMLWNDLVDAKVAMRVIEGLYDGVTTSELDNLLLKPPSMTIAHPITQLRRIAISNTFKYNKIIFGNNDRNV